MDFIFKACHGLVKKNFNGLFLFSVTPAEATSTGDVQAADDPPSARFTWTIENFSRLNVKKLYSEVFFVGGYKW